MPLPLDTPRADAWYADLTEEQLWQLYAIAKRTHNWAEVARIARDEFKIARDISSSAFYRWRDWMRRQDSDRRLASARAAVIEAEEMAKKTGVSDEAMIKAYKSLAAEAALSSGDADRAGKFVTMAMQLLDREQKSAELKLKAAAQGTKDELLKLAREKFEEEAARRTAAEARAEKAEAEAEALKATIKELEKALQDAGKVNVADPARVAAEVDRILGRKPQQ